jgi:NADH-quinone oxidoreductase subunit I
MAHNAPNEQPGLFARFFHWLGGIFQTLGGLMTGMGVTIRNFTDFRKVVTRHYPENREGTTKHPPLKMFPRYRTMLLLPHDEKGWHYCIACGTCAKHCPNDSISIVTRKNPTTGKKELDRWVYRFDQCTVCNQCVLVCPTKALAMGQDFEGAVFDRTELTYVLNRYAGPAAKVLSKLEEGEDKAQMTPLENVRHPRELVEGKQPWSTWEWEPVGKKAKV